MKRGDVVLVKQPGSPASKARPCIVLQRTSTMEEGVAKITVCSLTSQIDISPLIRPVVLPTPGNGLRKPSAAQIDWIYTHPIEVIGETIGALDEDALTAIDRALRRWLDL